MKVAFCLEYPIGMRGGVSILVETLLEEMVRLGHSIVLVSNDTSESLRESRTHTLIQKHIPWQNAKPTRAQARHLAEQLAAEGIDLAHFHFGGNFAFGNRFPFHCPISYLNRLGIPCFSTAHMVVGLLDGYCGPQKPFWFKLMMLPLAWLGKLHQLYHVRREIVVSRRDLAKMQGWYWPLSSRFTQIYHSRLRTDKAAAASLPRETFILNVGHVAWRKGQLVLAEAFAEIAERAPGWKLYLAGHDEDGDTAEKIRQLIAKKKLNDRIQLLGRRDDAPALMRQAGIYVQPSYWEGLPLSLQESLFHGCPAIASRIGAHQELIDEDQNGLLFEPGNVSQLAQALEKLIQNPDRRDQFSRAAAATILKKDMTIEGMVRQHLKIYGLSVKGSLPAE